MPNDAARIAERIEEECYFDDSDREGPCHCSFDEAKCEAIISEELASLHARIATLEEANSALRKALQAMVDLHAPDWKGMTVYDNAIAALALQPSSLEKLAEAKVIEDNRMTTLEQFACDEANRLQNEIMLEDVVHLSRLFDSLIAAGVKGREEERARLEWFMAEQGRTWSRRGDLCPGQPFVVWNADRTEAGEGNSLIEAIDDALARQAAEKDLVTK